MDRDFRRGQFENQPALVGVDKFELQHVLDEGLVGLSILGIDDDMSAVDHRALRSAFALS
jgi:hypothetical protein